VSKKVHFEFGKPMTITGRGDAEHQQIIDFISGRLKEWGGKVADAEMREESKPTRGHGDGVTRR